jgi:hypothetical protein
MAVVELGGLSEGICDELVSDLQFVQNRRFHWHRIEGQGLMSVAVFVASSGWFRVVLGGVFL